MERDLVAIETTREEEMGKQTVHGTNAVDVEVKSYITLFIEEVCTLVMIIDILLRNFLCLIHYEKLNYLPLYIRCIFRCSIHFTCFKLVPSYFGV